jgi:hypothetical protein
MSERQFVFISGPYSQGDVAANVAEAIHAGDLVAKAGHVPFIPHLTHVWSLIHPHEDMFWLRQGIHWLGKCDCLIRLFGPSLGAEKEVLAAREAGIPVYRSVEAWLEAVNRTENVTAHLGTGAPTPAVAITPDG